MEIDSTAAKLVFLDTGTKEPYTTHEIVAECAEVQHRTVTKLIQRYHVDLERFGVLRFKIAKPSAGNLGGRPQKVYLLNEQQATLLITYLRNTPAVTAFKLALVQEFYNMRAELARRDRLRADGKPGRRRLTDMIQANPGHHRWEFKQYTDLAYKAAFGKTAAQIKSERAPGENVRCVDLLTADELEQYQKMEETIAAMYSVGVPYAAMKTALVSTTREKTGKSSPGGNKLWKK